MASGWNRSTTHLRHRTGLSSLRRPGPPAVRRAPGGLGRSLRRSAGAWRCSRMVSWSAVLLPMRRQPGPGRFRQRRGNPRADFRDGHEPRSSRPWGPDCCGPAVRGTTTAPAQPAVGRARRTGRCWHCSATGGPVTAGSWNANVGHGRHLPVVYFLALLSEEGEPTECGLAGRAAPGGPGPEDAQGPRPAHRRDTPDFWERAADVCTLYLGPPEGAVVHGWPRTHAGTSTGPHHTPPGPIRPSCSSPPWPAGSCDTATSPAATT